MKGLIIIVKTNIKQIMSDTMLVILASRRTYGEKLTSSSDPFAETEALAFTFDKIIISMSPTSWTEACINSAERMLQEQNPQVTKDAQRCNYSQHNTNGISALR